MKSFCAWMILGCCVAGAGEYQSVLVNKTEEAAPAVVSNPVPVVVATPVCNSCETGCCKVQVYNEKVEDRKTCRKTIFGKVIKREVKRTTLTPVR